MGDVDCSVKFFKCAVIMLTIFAGINTYQLVRNNMKDESRFKILKNAIGNVRSDVEDIRSDSNKSSIAALYKKLEDIEYGIEGLNPKASRMSLDTLYAAIVAIQSGIEEIQNGPKLERNGWGSYVRTKKDFSLSKLNESVEDIKNLLIDTKDNPLGDKNWQVTEKLKEIESKINSMNKVLEGDGLAYGIRKKSLPKLYDMVEEIERMIRFGR